jgi:hypothetical protein
VNEQRSLAATCVFTARNRGGFATQKEQPEVIIESAETEAAPPAPVLLTSDELAARWRITRQKVNQMRAAGQLKVVRLPSGAFRYDLGEILRLEKPVFRSRQPNKARAAEAIKRGRAKAGASRASREVTALA